MRQFFEISLLLKTFGDAAYHVIDNSLTNVGGAFFLFASIALLSLLAWANKKPTQLIDSITNPYATGGQIC